MRLSNEEYWKQGEANVERNVAAVTSFIELCPEPLSGQIQRMMDGPVGAAFFSAPASTRRSFHYAFPGGLVAHSLNVVRNALKISKALAPDRWPGWKVSLCALFHDLGKAGDGERPYYVPTTSQWKSERGEFYELNREAPFMPSSELGLYMLAKHGIVLEPEMHIAIRLNDGPAAAGNQDYSFLEPDLAVLINMADNWAMRAEKAEDR